MLTIDGLACTWDFKDRLIAVENAEMRAEYTYDYTDRRITKKVTLGSAGVAPAPTTTHYINRYFEIRDYDQPVKYVWQGETRVARITGTLTATATRTQKLRLQRGWNLVALSVAGTQAQLDPATHAVIDEATWWNAASSAYTPLRAAGPAVPAGVPAWLYANADAVITLTGPATPSVPVPASLPAGGQFLANPTADAWSLPAVFPSDAEIWGHLTGTGLWLPRLAGPDAFLSDTSFTKVLPGASVFVRAATAAALNLAPAALAIRYYHHAHLGSSSAITDQSGTLVEETANYPFGHPRNQHQPAGLTEPYGFTQKERDGESGLHYLGARFLLSNVGRFSRTDTVADNHRFLVENLGSPQLLNSYTYAGNRSIVANDPSGEWLNFVVGAAIGAAGNAVTQIGTGMISGKSFSESVKQVNLTSVAFAAAGGAITGGFSNLGSAVQIAKSLAWEQAKGVAKELAYEGLKKGADWAMRDSGVSAKTRKEILKGADLIKTVKEVAEGVNKLQKASLSKIEKAQGHGLNMAANRLQSDRTGSIIDLTGKAVGEVQSALETDKNLAAPESSQTSGASESPSVQAAPTENKK